MSDLKDKEVKMRSREYFHDLKLPSGMWKIIRVDGKGFSSLTKNMKHPFDLRFRDRMIFAAKSLMKEMNGRYAHTHSDEISILFPPDWEMFNNGVEKLVTTAASMATRAFNHNHKQNTLGTFDGRIWMSPVLEEVVEYFDWRQDDCVRNAINSTVFWHMVDEKGASRAQATSWLEGKDFSWKNEYLHAYGINFNNLPRWQKRGVAIYKEIYYKNGVDPRNGYTRLAERKRLRVNSILPTGEEYKRLIYDVGYNEYPSVVYRGSVTPRPEMIYDELVLV